jgi:hypothetical protein
VFGEMAPQLIIVGRDDPGLYEALCADWAGDKDVAVIIDRRVGQRRHQARTVSADRRQADRRREPPAEALLAWRGGGRAARKTDVLSVLSSGPASVAVRHRPLPKIGVAASMPAAAESAANEPVSRKSALIAPPGVVVGLMILLGSLSGGVVGGVAVWLFLAYEFGSALPWSASAGSEKTGLFAWCRRPLQKLLGSEPAAARKASRA